MILGITNHETVLSLLHKMAHPLSMIELSLLKVSIFESESAIANDIQTLQLLHVDHDETIVSCICNYHYISHFSTVGRIL